MRLSCPGTCSTWFLSFFFLSYSLCSQHFHYVFRQHYRRVAIYLADLLRRTFPLLSSVTRNVSMSHLLPVPLHDISAFEAKADTSAAHNALSHIKGASDAILALNNEISDLRLTLRELDSILRDQRQMIPL
ncbi:hypothetical protein F4825DRAFT_25063 [Nemania diffusa]|nr:hypothetical protein F4825DRAFT_25063 [Nemania diffusa]